MAGGNSFSAATLFIISNDAEKKHIQAGFTN